MRELRKDIQGLRALAVLSVIVYHFNSDYIPSGFAGVDVFFVISGFLMTSIIYKGISTKTFSLIRFYISRAKRIAPSLCVVVLVLLVFGYIFLDPMTFQQVGNHSLSSMLFYSNYTYLGESGYFDQSSKEKFLLHTWSLSVEWQFYIIYPMLIIGLKKVLLRKDFRIAIVILMLVSLAACLLITYKNPSYSYFMIATRAWEMMMGGVICLYPISTSEKVRRALEFIGIGLIFLSFFLFSESTPWPGFSALAPTIGASLVILANVKKSVIGSKPFQMVGQISYSMYLVHWVILVAFKKMYLDDSVFVYLVIVVASSAALYFFIEKRRSFGWHFLIIYLVAIFLSYFVSINGVSSRLGSAKEFMVDSATYRLQNEGYAGVANSKNPIYFNSSEKDFDFILIGSSHARHYYHYIMASNHKVVSLALDGCDSTRNYFSKSVGDICSKRYALTIDFIKKHPGKKVIWATVWNEPTNKRDSGFNNSGDNSGSKWLLEISAFASDIAGTKSSVYLVGDTPGTKKLMFECLAKNSLPINRMMNSAGCEIFEAKVDKPVNKFLLEATKGHENFHFIDARDALCKGQQCKVIVDGKPVYTDYGHLSKTGSNIVGTFIFNLIK